jgi:hypothetical protein
MITKEIASTLKRGQILHHKTLKNADGTPIRAKVNGAVKFWTTRPNEFRIPAKRGLYEYGYITEADGANWSL